MSAIRRSARKMPSEQRIVLLVALPLVLSLIVRNDLIMLSHQLQAQYDWNEVMNDVATAVLDAAYGTQTEQPTTTTTTTASLSDAATTRTTPTTTSSTAVESADDTTARLRKTKDNRTVDNNKLTSAVKETIAMGASKTNQTKAMNASSTIIENDETTDIPPLQQPNADPRVDPTAVKGLQRINTTGTDCTDPPGQGEERLMGYNVLTQKLRVAPNNSTIRVFCGIYTYAGHDRLIDAIHQTWGSHCDGFVAFSTLTRPGTVNLTHQGPESYGNMWQKTRSIVKYIYDYYLEDYDFFFLSGDDVYVIVENLKRFAAQVPPDETFPGGHWSPRKNFPKAPMLGGGSGVLMNRLSLR